MQLFLNILSGMTDSVDAGLQEQSHVGSALVLGISQNFIVDRRFCKILIIDQ